MSIAPARVHARSTIGRATLAVGLLWGLMSPLSVYAECDDRGTFDSVYAEAWGIDRRNTRYQPRSSLNSANAERLALKWVYGLAEETPRFYPLVTRDTIVIGDSGRGLVALDRETGCERWLFPHDGQIASAILHTRLEGRDLLIFNDRTAGVFAIEAGTGNLVWHATVRQEPLPWYSGSPVVVGDVLYIPVSSREVALAVNPLYGCCVTSGGLAAFDLETGAPLWYVPTISEPAKQTGRHFLLVEKHGPSGASVWSAPAYDAERGRLYFGTGQNFSHPTTDTSDALFAVSALSGEIAWVRQFTANDAYTAACNLVALNHPNCPEPMGPDVDFGAPAVLTLTRSGRPLLLAGQKSADVHAVDPDTGELVWTRKLGRGGIIGGVHWGLAVNERQGLVFVPVSDKELVGFPAPGKPTPGLYALDTETGVLRWSYTRESRCDDRECVFGLSAAAVAANDIVVTGSMDGYLMVHQAVSGELLWEHDAWREYPSVNAVPTRGGAFDAHGAMLADDLLMVTAGYRYVGQQRGGNAFLLFQVQPSLATGEEEPRDHRPSGRHRPRGATERDAGSHD